MRRSRTTSSPPRAASPRSASRTSTCRCPPGGRSQSLAQILDSSSQITSTFGQNTELLNSLVGQLTEISGTLATHSGELGTGLDNLTGFTDTLARNSANLVALRDQAPDLISRFNQLLQASMPANECILQSLSAALPVALSQKAMDSLRYESQTSPQLTRVLNEITPKVNGKSNLNIPHPRWRCGTPPSGVR